MSFTLSDLSFTYPGATTPALDRVSLRLPADASTALLGPSGCGKSTLLNLLGLQLEHPPPRTSVVFESSAGRVDYADLTRSRRSDLRRTHFGHVPQSSYLLPHLTLLDNVAVPLALAGWAKFERRLWARTLLEEVDPGGSLWAASRRTGRDVSGGQRQRAAVLRAVAHDPAVVFADEPVSNLDPGSTRAVVDLLRGWRSGELHRRCARSLLASAKRLPASLSARLRLWADGPPRPRTLLIVCHHVDTARRAGDHFLVFGADRRPALGPSPPESSAP